MAKVITFSRTFPVYHPKAGQPTYFVEKFLNSFPETFENISIDEYFTDLNGGRFYSGGLINVDILEPKYHTIRAGKRWKVGDYFSPRVWSGKPYNSKMITIAPDTLIKKVYDFKIDGGVFFINNNKVYFEDILYDIAHNDGLVRKDFFAWFKYPTNFDGQIICWNENINYH